MKKEQITVQGAPIAILDDDFISLTDIAKRFGDAPDDVVKNWMRNKNTIVFLGTWESRFNPHFNPAEFDGFKEKAGLNSFTISPKKWAESVNAIGIRTKSGRYGGGTFAHKDIAFAFCYWLSPDFQLYVSWEFQRLKSIENRGWTLRRELARLNYPLHTEAVRQMIDQSSSPKALAHDGPIYASEADVLNVAVFGKTAREWRAENPDLKGNIRDHADIERLHVLANMESYNAILIRNGLSQWQRLNELSRTAAEQFRVFEELNIAALSRLKQHAEETAIRPTDNEHNNDNAAATALAQ